MTAGGTAVIDCDDLHVRYGDRVAVDGVSFAVGAGEIVALLGPNGAGKTSTVETLEGYRRPDGGAVRVLGLDPMRQRRELNAHIGVMLQRGGVYPTMTPARTLALFARYYDDPDDVDALLERMRLRDVARTPWRRLSGGEQQRLSLALALVGRPTVAFLDEPTAGVDPEGRLAIRAVIAGLAEAGVAVLLTTHELDEAERLADRVVIIDRGKQVAAGAVAELSRQAGAAGVRFAAPTGVDLAALAAALGLPTAAARHEGTGWYAIDAPPTPELVAAITSWLAANGVPLSNLRTDGGGLEAVYLALLRDAGDANDADTP